MKVKETKLLLRHMHTQTAVYVHLLAEPCNA